VAHVASLPWEVHTLALRHPAVPPLANVLPRLLWPRAVEAYPDEGYPIAVARAAQVRRVALARVPRVGELLDGVHDDAPAPLLVRANPRHLLPQHQRRSMLLYRASQRAHCASCGRFRDAVSQRARGTLRDRAA
jgi:hypothetical protein